MGPKSVVFFGHEAPDFSLAVVCVCVCPPVPVSVCATYSVDVTHMFHMPFVHRGGRSVEVMPLFASERTIIRRGTRARCVGYSVTFAYLLNICSLQSRYASFSFDCHSFAHLQHQRMDQALVFRAKILKKI